MNGARGKPVVPILEIGRFWSLEGRRDARTSAGVRRGEREKDGEFRTKEEEKVFKDW